MKSYVVFAEAGEYSDYRAWIVASFDSREEGDSYVAELKASHDKHHDYKCDRADCAGWKELPAKREYVEPGLIVERPGQKFWRSAYCRCPERPVFVDPIQGPTDDHVDYTLVEVEKNPCFEKKK